ncbi:LysR family transcriptional regulator [Pseudaestuariivita atlantica]|uniref:HTH lysR-type domain-containing protein n=1 Tax=Pseudaestuariivita atlantica TaxID=1317121 RepID=A0A0L1JN14_9RHOB|nr:LysR substrate-binding domain-containing protein [Pseudaestuariivita atlantica]KNG92798.1 hypothetical protein ATO11_15105 [Pseudaestuariivita atlantica]
MRAVSHLKGWQAADAVARLGGVAAAAAELGVTEAAVTAQIRRLEARLGRDLFRRTSAGLVPTSSLAGEREALARAFAALGEVAGRLDGAEMPDHLSITVTQTFAEVWLPRHLPDLFATEAELDLRLDTRWEVVDLSRSDIQFAIRYMDDPGPDLGSVDLMPSGVVPICTRDFARRYGLGPETRTLAGVPMVWSPVATSDPEWCGWHEWAARTGIEVDPQGAGAGAAVEMSASGARMARMGLGLVLGGLADSLHGVMDGELVMPLGPRSVVPARFWHRLVWQKARRLGPVQRRFRDWMAAKAAADRAAMRRTFGV